jgi:microcystin-dependent protein
MDPLLGEIRLMPYSFAPNGWLPCDGRLLPINQQTALYSLLGTMYGGDGRVTFALPDLRGRAAVGLGQGPGLSNYVQGAVAGTETVTLQQAQMPAHIHGLNAQIAVSTDSGLQKQPQGNYYAANNTEQYGGSSAGTMAPDVITGQAGQAGGNQPHDNHQPYLVLNYCIATTGQYPQRP